MEVQMLTAAGNINRPYRVIGVITVSIVKPEKSGCSGSGLPVDAAYSDAVNELQALAERKGADGVIHIGFEHRVSTSAACGASNANFELYAWGTAVSLVGSE
jgi:hypothetical protein